MSRRMLLPLALAFALALACVTINVYFPAAEIKDLSERIEKAVREQAAEQTGEPVPAEPDSGQDASPQQPPPAPQSLLDELLGGVAYAQREVPAPEVTNPAIRKLIESRAARLAALNKYKSAGAIGESNRALVEVRNLEAAGDLKARAELQRIVKAENADREELFKEMAAEKGVDTSQLDKIRETYAATMREFARPGDLVQMPDGSWKTK
ncbi:MAG: DUF1318 domain-containing protein [Acidobacteria bacterium]|nr:DUF1318 domain-containing protein [Acidobacteriota bacterium]